MNVGAYNEHVSIWSTTNLTDESGTQLKIQVLTRIPLSFGIACMQTLYDVGYMIQVSFLLNAPSL